MKLLLPAKGKRLMDLGSVDPQTRRKLVRGRLVDNVIKGKDGGSMSAKILGSDSELNMWVPEQNQGLVIINVPQSAIAQQGRNIESCGGRVMSTTRVFTRDQIATLLDVPPLFVSYPLDAASGGSRFSRKPMFA